MKDPSKELRTYKDLPEMSFMETMRLLARSWSYVRFFKIRFAIKWVLTLISLMFPILVLPWSLQIVIDHVVLGKPLISMYGYVGYPEYIYPLLDFLSAKSPLEIMIWVSLISFLLVILFGAYSQDQRDETDASMVLGNDIATRQEDLTHGGFSFSGGISGYIEYKMNSRLTQSVNHLLRAKLFEKICSLPINTLEDQRIGDSIYRVMYDTPSINQIFYEVINRPTLSTITFCTALLSMYSAFPHVPEVLWCAAVIFPLYVIISGPFSSVMRRMQERSRYAGSKTTSTIEEGMDNILAVQSLGGEQEEREKFKEDSEESFKQYRFVNLVEILLANAQGLAYVLALTLAFFVIISKVIDGQLTPGNYGALFFFYTWMSGPAIAFATLWIHLQRYAPGMRRVFALMDLPSEKEVGSKELLEIKNGIKMRDVGFVYPDGRRALKEINLEAKIGEIIALVGPTGAGKTTLAYLIPRFQDSSEGKVFIDDLDVSELTSSSLRNQITYVFQETQLFSDSIFRNITFGKQDASIEEVERVATICGIHDFISKLPEGYETKLGSTSMSKISVGQKQRISIARGLIRDSKILILDEPTSALDPETEKYLVAALKEASKNKLVIVIAHRLSTIAKSDKIIFLEKGRIIEQGSPRELLSKKDGSYRNFIKLQTE